LTLNDPTVKDIERQLQLNRMMAEEDIMLAYRDVITENTVQHLLDISESRMESLGDEKKLKKRVFSVLIECLQNIVNHGHDDGDGKPGIVLILREKDAVVVRTGNLILNSEVGDFEERVREVNDLTGSDMRAAYNERLSVAEFSDRGGAGLGLLDMCKKSGRPIHHAVHHVNDEMSFLSISITVPKEG
jgi:anti-sigma regulatory factor (Ser/Thr protein kinase)